MSHSPTCAVCRHGFTFGSKCGESADQDTWYDVCNDCYASGAHDTWRTNAINRIRTSGVMFVSTNNLAKDLETVERYLRHDSRLEDGVCPNGCARLVKDDDITLSCPVCGFNYQNPSGVKLPK